MRRKNVLALIAVLSLLAPAAAHAEENEQERGQLMPPAGNHRSELSRPAALPALYASLSAMHVWDVYSTRSALNAGAREANPAATRLAGNPASLLGLKAATTASTIFFAERMWKKNRAGAIVMLAAINGATAAVSVHNMRNARAGAARQ